MAEAKGVAEVPITVIMNKKTSPNPNTLIRNETGLCIYPSFNKLSIFNCANEEYMSNIIIALFARFVTIISAHL
jgi:hypothetical protein